MIHTGSYTALELSIIPESSQDWAAMLLDGEGAFFEGQTGNALLVPTRDLPGSYRHEFPTVSGTCIEQYTPVLDVFLWQFGRVWMGLPGEQKAYIAAPREHVHGALNDDIYLISNPEAIVRAFPDDCNLHWRSFLSTKQGLTTPEQSPFAQLVRLLQKAGVVLPETERADSLMDFCQRWSIPLSQRAGSVPRTSLSATTFLWLVPHPNDQWMARLGTIFDCQYGIDLDD